MPTLVDDAERALRAVMLVSDDPLGRLASLASEIWHAFAKQAAVDGDDDELFALEEAFHLAYARLWAEYGGDPSRMPGIFRQTH